MRKIISQSIKVIPLFLLSVILNFVNAQQQTGLYIDVVPEFQSLDLVNTPSMDITFDFQRGLGNTYAGGSPRHNVFDYHQTNNGDQDLEFKAKYYLVDECLLTEYYISEDMIQIYGNCIGNDGTGFWSYLPVVKNIVFPSVPVGNYRLKVVFEDYNFMSAVDYLDINMNVKYNDYYGFLNQENTNFKEISDVNNAYVEINNLTHVLNSPILPISVNTIYSGFNCTTLQYTIDAQASGGVAPYTYLWSNGVVGSQNILSVGNYTLTVTDAQGCAITFPIHLVNQTNAEFDYFGSVVIDAASDNLVDNTGDGIIRIKGLVIFGGIDANEQATGVNYTISNKIFEFEDYQYGFQYPDQNDNNLTLPRSGFFINQKSDLTLNSVTLRNVPVCNSMWQGVKVLGHPNDKSLGGQLHLNSSVIENAHTGVNVGDYRNFQPGENVVYILNGTIEAANSTFKNNNIAINFADSHGEDVPSFIRECNFVCDALLADQTAYPGLGSSIFINMVNTRSLPIKGCNFTGNVNFAEDKRGTAIRSYDANYKVTSGVVGSPLIPNNFQDLTKGLDIYSNGSLTNTVRITDNRFTNVMQGVISNGSNFDEIYKNIFDIPLGTATVNSWGINLYNNSGYLLVENDFNAATSNNYTYGAIARNNSLASGEIYHNNFNGNFFAATQAEQNNSLLSMKCNKYPGINTYDWAITSGSLADQGSCGNLTSPAANIFALCTTNDESQIYKHTSVPNFTYTTQASLEADLDCKSPGVLFPLNSCIQAYNEAVSCPNHIALPGIILNPNGGLSSVNREIRRLQDLGDITGVIAKLTTGNIPGSTYLKIPTLIAEGDCAASRQKLVTVNRTSPEGNNFYKLYDVLTGLCETGRSIEQMTPVELAIIHEVSTSGTRVSVNAQAVEARYSKEFYWRTPERPIELPQFMAENNLPQEQNTSLSVFPNPSKGEITIEILNKTKGKVLVSDALGRIHFEYIVEENDLQKMKQTLSLNSGIYIIQYTDENGFVETRQVFIEN